MKFHIITYGCQMNVYDSSLVASILEAEGLTPTKDIEEADIIIVNTCSVREHAELRALGRISALQRVRRERPNLKIGVVGCMAERLGQSIPGADFFVGPKSYDKLQKILRDLIYHMRYKKLRERIPITFPRPDRAITAFLPVMRGCNNYCAYCIVPYLRGEAISRNPVEIIEELRFLKEGGIKEVTLLGQSVNEYKWGDIDFPKLLRMLSKESEQVRIRFLTSHPAKMSDELIKAMAECDPVCEHIHLPIQSGSNRILRMMERGYTVEEYKDWILKLRRSIPSIGLTTDILVGFPEETEKDYNETINTVRELRFDFAYMFMYSKREGTKAAGFTEEIPTTIKKERLSRIIKIQNKITREVNQKLIGKEFEILIEGKSRRDNLPMGKTRTGKEVIIKTPEERVKELNSGDLVRACVESISGWTPVGSLLS